ncbi:hypothetical protein B0H13DRAFT_1892524 [Mycena leptocephala]|nr:hypothetical protein B0H13DRAFT_1892524 [Mycena leptocephala]
MLKRRPSTTGRDATVRDGPSPSSFSDPSLAGGSRRDLRPSGQGRYGDRRSIPPPPSVPPSERGESPLTEIGEDASASDGSSGNDDRAVATPKIACPKGLTRKTLSRHVEWVHGDRTDEITLAKKHLDLKEVFTNQDDGALKNVYHLAKTQFPELRRYANNWPVKCILQAHLKVTKTASRTAIVWDFSRALGGKAIPRKPTKVCLNSSGVTVFGGVRTDGQLPSTAVNLSKLRIRTQCNTLGLGPFLGCGRSSRNEVIPTVALWNNDHEQMELMIFALRNNEHGQNGGGSHPSQLREQTDCLRSLLIQWS